MRPCGFGDACTLSCFAARLPEHFRRNRLIRAPAVFRSGEQIGLRPHPTPVLAQGFGQLRAEGHIPIPVSLAVADMDYHPATVDVLYLEVAQLSPAHTRRVQGHEHGPMEKIAGRVDEPACFFLGQDGGQSAGRSRIGHFLNRIRLAEEKSQGRRVIADRAHTLFPLLQEIDLVRADLIGPELIGRPMEIPGKVLNGFEI